MAKFKTSVCKKGRSNHSLGHCIRNTIFSITAYPPAA
jgi:hypothetical protein